MRSILDALVGGCVAISIVVILEVNIRTTSRVDRRRASNVDRASIRHVDTFAASPDRCLALTVDIAVATAPGLYIDVSIPLL